jgi:hypothetical protein
MMRHLPSIFLFMLALTCGRSVQAQDAAWLFVPVFTGAQEIATSAPLEIDALVAAAQERDVPVMRREQAATEFEARHSAEPAVITADDVRSLQRLSESALRSMAAADYETAQRELDAAVRLYERAPDEFNRQVPKQVLDLCLFRALALIETGVSPARVKDEVRECRLKIPLEIEADLLKHTNPVVRRLLREVSAEIVSERTGVLQVRGQDGCQVRIDGVDSGRTQNGRFTATALIRGTHRVTLSCHDTQARTHRVQVDENTPPLVIDTAFDAVVHTRPFVYLRASAATKPERIDDHARKLGKLLDATIVLLQRAANGSVELRRIGNEGRHRTATLPPPSQVGEPWPMPERLMAIDDLLYAPPAVASTQPGAVETSATGVASSDVRTSLFASPATRRRARRVSFGLLGVGAAALATSGGLHAKARNLREQSVVAPDGRPLNDAEEKGDQAGLASVLTGAGSLLSVGVGLSMVMAVRYDQGKSNLALALSTTAIGAGLLSVAIWQLMGDVDCSGPCAERDNRVELGALPLVAGAGLLGANLISALTLYLPARARRTKGAEHPPQLGLSGRTLFLRGSF